MYEITIRPDRRFWEDWPKLTTGEVPYLLTRVAAVTCNNPDPFQQTDGYDLALDRSNGWWAERRGDELLIAYRYGGGGNAPFMEALQVVLRHIVRHQDGPGNDANAADGA